MGGSEQQCVPTNGECGGPGRHTETCCHGKCERQPFVGGSGIMKCVDKQISPLNSYSEGSEQQCVPTNGECGGPGRQTETCCHGKCQKLLGGDGTMKCVEEQQCVPTNGECGGAGRHTETCCHGKCESQPFVGGSGIMKCVDKQCAAPHAECGGPGRQALH